MTIPESARRLMQFAITIVGGAIATVYYLLEWAWRILVWIDQGLNVFIGPPLNFLLNPDYRFGDPDETLSSVFGKNTKYARDSNCKLCRWLCRLLDKIDPGHCVESIEPDEGDIV